MQLQIRNIIFIICLLSLFACGDLAKKKTAYSYSESRMLMGTFVRIDVCGGQQSKNDLDQTMSKVWDRLEGISWNLSEFETESDIGHLNAADGNPVVIGADTYQILKEAILMNHLTNGAFDVTVLPLMDVWKKNAAENKLPTREELSLIKDIIGSDNIDLMTGNRVRLKRKGAKITLGGIAKGYAVDEAARLLKENGFSNFLIDAGGDLYVHGQNCEGSLWRIGIRDPKQSNKIIDTLHLTNTAVTTSGDYEQYYEINGQRWSHIINPITGFPQKGVISATVIAPTALEADALSTALCVLGSQNGMRLMDSLGEGVAAIVFEMQDQNEFKAVQSAQYKSFERDK